MLIQAHERVTHCPYVSRTEAMLTFSENNNDDDDGVGGTSDESLLASLLARSSSLRPAPQMRKDKKEKKDKKDKKDKKEKKEEGRVETTNGLFSLPPSTSTLSFTSSSLDAPVAVVAGADAKNDDSSDNDNDAGDNDTGDKLFDGCVVVDSIDKTALTPGDVPINIILAEADDEDDNDDYKNVHRSNHSDIEDEALYIPFRGRAIAVAPHDDDDDDAVDNDDDDDTKSASISTSTSTPALPSASADDSSENAMTITDILSAFAPGGPEYVKSEREAVKQEVKKLHNKAINGRSSDLIVLSSSSGSSGSSSGKGSGISSADESKMPDGMPSLVRRTSSVMRCALAKFGILHYIATDGHRFPWSYGYMRSMMPVKLTLHNGYVETAPLSAISLDKYDQDVDMMIKSSKKKTENKSSSSSSSTSAAKGKTAGGYIVGTAADAVSYAQAAKEKAQAQAEAEQLNRRVLAQAMADAEMARDMLHVMKQYTLFISRKPYMSLIAHERVKASKSDLLNAAGVAGAGAAGAVAADADADAAAAAVGTSTKTSTSAAKKSSNAPSRPMRLEVCGGFCAFVISPRTCISFLLVSFSSFPVFRRVLFTFTHHIFAYHSCFDVFPTPPPPRFSSLLSSSPIFPIFSSPIFPISSRSPSVSAKCVLRIT